MSNTCLPELEPGLLAPPQLQGLAEQDGRSRSQRSDAVTSSEILVWRSPLSGLSWFHLCSPIPRAQNHEAWANSPRPDLGQKSWPWSLDMASWSGKAEERHFHLLRALHCAIPSLCAGVPVPQDQNPSKKPSPTSLLSSWSIVGRTKDKDPDWPGIKQALSPMRPAF